VTTKVRAGARYGRPRPVPVLALFLFFLVAACSALRPLDPPSVQLSDLRLLDSSGVFEQRFLLALRIGNPNPFDLPLEGLRFSLEINDAHFAQGLSNQALTIPALGEEIVTVEASTNILEIVRQILLLGKTGELTYAVDGEAFLGSALGGRIPFHRRGELRLAPPSEGVEEDDEVKRLIPI
jgi:LEA14-like dessication related protein